MSDEATSSTSETGGDTAAPDPIRQAATELSDRRAKSAPVAEVTYRDPAIAPKTLTPQKAGRELEEFRRSNGQIDDRPIEEIKYNNPDDPKYQQRTPRQAAQDLAEYRAALLAKFDGETAPAESAPATEQPAEQLEQQPDPVQQREPPRTAAETIERASELLRSEKAEDRAAASELFTQAAQQTRSESHALNERTGQAYTQAVQQLEGVVAANLLSEFGGVNPAELAQKDPAAFARLQKMATVYQNLQQQSMAQHRASQEVAGQQFQAWAAQQDALASKAVPEAADPKFQAAASEALKGYGYTAAELADAYAGKVSFTMRDARVQRVLADATRYSQAVTKARNAVARPLPQVQRPGVSQPRGAGAYEAVRALDSRLSRTGNAKDAAALLIASRRARSR